MGAEKFKVTDVAGGMMGPLGVLDVMRGDRIVKLAPAASEASPGMPLRLSSIATPVDFQNERDIRGRIVHEVQITLRIAGDEDRIARLPGLDLVVDPDSAPAASRTELRRELRARQEPEAVD